jgi:hypothetical protein
VCYAYCEKMERLWATVEKVKEDVSACKDHLYQLQCDVKAHMDDSQSRFQDLFLESNEHRTKNNLMNQKMKTIEESSGKLRSDFDRLTSDTVKAINNNLSDHNSKSVALSEMVLQFGNKIDKMDQVAGKFGAMDNITHTQENYIFFIY